MFTVLIVDDDKLARKGLIAVTDWAKCGLEVVGDVANGLLAMEFLKTHQVDLAIVDMSMPVMSGLDFIRASTQLYPDLQYIVLSFHEDFDYVQSALRLGALDYISKLRIEEDCTQSFIGVAEMLKAKRSPQAKPHVKPEEAGVSADVFEGLCLEWRKLQWIYSAQRFDRLLKALEQSGISQQQLERLLILVAEEIDTVFAVRWQVPFLQTRKAGIELIRRMSHQTLEEIATRQDFGQLTHGILYSTHYLREHLDERPKEEEVAQLIGLSRSYFASSFREITGSTFSDFLRAERIEHAKELMCIKAMPPRDAAAAVGYDDYKYFQKVFRSQTGERCSDYFKQYCSIS